METKAIAPEFENLVGKEALSYLFSILLLKGNLLSDLMQLPWHQNAAFELYI
jgi:hypothetical protein